MRGTPAWVWVLLGGAGLGLVGAAVWLARGTSEDEPEGKLYDTVPLEGLRGALGGGYQMEVE